jgi:succinyl-CoA synthetase beta subunit
VEGIVKLHEYQAKELFSAYGIPVPAEHVIENVESLEAIMMPFPWVLKAQVLVGGRGKAGGIKRTRNRAEAKELAETMFRQMIKGSPVRKILVAPSVPIEQEYYVSLVLDRSHKVFALVASAEGGMEIEEVARTAPEKIFRRDIDPWRGLMPYEGRLAAKALGLSGTRIMEFAQIAVALDRILVQEDAELVEINPLALTPAGLVALDAKILDDSAGFRHNRASNDEEATPLEQKAKSLGLSYVELEGWVAVIGCGAGLVMASLDVLNSMGAKPANFLDIGGGASAELMRQGLAIVLEKPGVQSVLINIFAGITRCDEVAKGIVDYGPQVPIYVRMTGTNEESGIQFLLEHGYHAFHTMEEAASHAARLAREEGR